MNLPDQVLISLLALGTAFYIPLGVRRGYIQGIHAFTALSANFMLEGLVRLGGAYLLIRMGLGVEGAVLASVIAVIASYFLAKPSPGLGISPVATHPDFISEKGCRQSCSSPDKSSSTTLTLFS